MLLKNLKDLKINWRILFLFFSIALIFRLSLPKRFIAIDEMHYLSSIDTLSGNFLSGKYGLCNVYQEGKCVSGYSQNTLWSPGFFILGALLTLITRDPWISTTIINLILSSLSVYLAYSISKKLGNVYSGIAAAIMLILLPIHIKISQTALFGISNLFFLLLFFEMHLQKQQSSLLSLAYFTIIRPESFILTPLILILTWKKLNKKYLWLLVLLILFVTIRSLQPLQNDIYWSSTLSSPFSNLMDKLKFNLSYFVDSSFINPLILGLALFSFKKRKKFTLLFILSFLLFSTYKIGYFYTFDEISKYALLPSSMLILVAAETINSKNKLLFLLPFMFFFVNSIDYITFNTPTSQVMEILTTEGNTIIEGKIITKLTNLVHFALPKTEINYERFKGESWVIDSNIINIRKINIPKNCEIIDFKSFKLNFEKYLNISHINCNLSSIIE